MIDSIIQFSIKQRWVILLLALGSAILGAYNYTRLPIDAVPDITNVQVQINTEAPGYSPLEVEQRVTFAVENAMGGLPHLDYTRSVSRYGLSQVTVVFKDGTDIYFGRQLIAERLQEVKSKLPPSLEPSMGPIATGLGEIFMFTVTAEPSARNEEGKAYTPTDLRTIQDWIIKPQLRNIPGVIEVNSIGGYEKQFHVTPDPNKLVTFDVTLRQLMEALDLNNAIVGAGAGAYHSAWVTMNQPVLLPPDARSVEDFAAHWDQISDRTGDFVPQSGAQQSQAILVQLQAAMKG